MEKIAVFDFCETLVNFQTFDPFMKYIIERKFPNRYRILCSRWFRKICQITTKIIRRCGFRGHLYKTILVRQIKGIREKELRKYGRNYYEGVIRINLIPETVAFFKEIQKAGYRIMIVSGGSELYIRYFADEFGIADVISSELKFENEICCGKLATDCMGENKITAIRDYMKEREIQGELALGVTDSISDKPMLENCMRKVVISHGRHQNWVTKDMEEIIWE